MSRRRPPSALDAYLQPFTVLLAGKAPQGACRGLTAPRKWEKIEKKRGASIGKPPAATVSTCYLGRITESITWITPLLHRTSVAMTVALSTLTFPFLTRILTFDP